MKRVSTKPNLRAGTTSLEVLLATFVVTVMGMGLYYLAQQSVTGLHDFVATLVGSPY